MRLRAFLAVISLFAAAVAAAQAYRWVDEDGVVHYSDRPRPGAEQVDLPRRPPRPSAPAPRAGSAAPVDEAVEDEAPFRYESLSVASPGAEETLWNIEGILNVSLDLKPALQPGHQVRVYFDGEQRQVQGTSFQIEEVWRGVHNIQAEVVDQNGELLIRSRTNRFYVQQNTIVPRRRPGVAPR